MSIQASPDIETLRAQREAHNARCDDLMFLGGGLLFLACLLPCIGLIVMGDDLGVRYPTGVHVFLVVEALMAMSGILLMLDLPRWEESLHVPMG
jgi:thiol:disulfide interchange protein